MSLDEILYFTADGFFFERSLQNMSFDEILYFTADVFCFLKLSLQNMSFDELLYFTADVFKKKRKKKEVAIFRSTLLHYPSRIGFFCCPETTPPASRAGRLAVRLHVVLKARSCKLKTALHPSRNTAFVCRSANDAAAGVAGQAPCRAPSSRRVQGGQRCWGSFTCPGSSCATCLFESRWSQFTEGVRRRL